MTLHDSNSLGFGVFRRSPMINAEVSIGDGPLSVTIAHDDHRAEKDHEPLSVNAVEHEETSGMPISMTWRRRRQRWSKRPLREGAAAR